jgi:hypothetical protein
MERPDGEDGVRFGDRPTLAIVWELENDRPGLWTAGITEPADLERLRVWIQGVDPEFYALIEPQLDAGPVEPL